MGGWGLGGSNGELIETHFNRCPYKKNKEADEETTEEGSTYHL